MFFFLFFLRKLSVSTTIIFKNTHHHLRLAYLIFRNAYVIFKSPRHFSDQVGISESHERVNPYKLIPYDLGCILKLVSFVWPAGGQPILVRSDGKVTTLEIDRHVPVFFRAR